MISVRPLKQKTKRVTRNRAEDFPSEPATAHFGNASAFGLALGEPELPGRRADNVTEMAGQMAVIGKACSIRNLRDREIRHGQHLLGAFHTLLCEVVVRGDAGRM